MQLLPNLSRRGFGIAALGLTAALTRRARADAGMVELPTGVALFCEAVGKGRPMLVIHGGLGLDHSYFQPWLDPLQTGFRLIYPDLRGNGRSTPGPDADFTLENMVADLDALRDRLGIQQWIVLGHSYGGYLAQLYALTHADRVGYLILADTSPAPRRISHKEGAQLLALHMTPEIRQGFAHLLQPSSDEDWKNLWHTILPAYFYDFPTELLVATDRTVYRQHALILGASLSSSLDLRPRLGEIAGTPTLVAVGRRDGILPVSHSEALFKGIPSAELAVFDRSGHFPFIEERDRFLGVVRRFLGD